MSLLHRLLHRLDNDGPKSFALNIFRTLRRSNRREPEAQGRPVEALDFLHPFDLQHGTDTSGFIPGPELTSAPLTRANPAFYTTAYYGVAPSSLHQALEHLPIAPESFPSYTFVDLGCGKGRALLVAAAFGFGGLLGVELSGQLCDIARSNGTRDARITILEQDAAQVEYPQTGLVLFLYHPFLAPVLRRVLANLERQLKAHPRPVLLLYATPSYAKLLAKYTFLEKVWDYGFDLSAEDAAADRHGMTRDHYTLYKGVS